MRQQYLPGWRFAALRGAFLSLIVLIVNFAFTISKRDQVLYTGHCSKVEKINTGIHVLINALSTLLLGASNFCMQCFSAPTRQEVDTAHKSRYWLDIGVLSIRNLRRINRKRVILWALLGATSLPLHLL